MIKIAWAFAFMTSAGPIVGEVAEPRDFPSVAECRAFGEAMAPRTAAFVRGTFQLDETVKVQVIFVCSGEGAPA